MNNVLRIVVVILMLFSCFAGISYGGNNELMKLIESKDFWTTYKWGTLEESELYQSTEWKLTGRSGEGDIIRALKYSTKSQSDIWPLTDLTMSVDMNMNVSSYNLSLMNTTTDDYTKLVNWCNDRFGYTQEERYFTDNINGLSRNVKVSFWELENTNVKVSIGNNLSQGKDSVGYITTLSFTHNNHKRGKSKHTTR